MKRISIETKESIINRYNNGESVAELTEATGVARSTIYGWLKSSQSESENKPVNKKTVNDLERKLIRLSTLIEILQKVFDVENIPTQLRLEELEKLYGELLFKYEAGGALPYKIPFRKRIQNGCERLYSVL